ncbi:MAG: F0F1 ATP synthase subunit delta [bacterium]|nr:F0F1 ATP synthase subunit delta [bacterium]
MKQSSRVYAQGFVAACSEGVSLEVTIKNLVRLVDRNNDWVKWPKILAAVAKEWRRQNNERSVVLESARPLSAVAKKEIIAKLEKSDQVTERINPALLAGFRLIADEEEIFDASLKRKLDSLFAFVKE